MGKHETGYARVERDLYATREAWVTQALLKHVDLIDAHVWEPAAGRHAMMALVLAKVARVHCSDIAPERVAWECAAVHDFTTATLPRGWQGRVNFDAIVTNPPFGSRGKLAEAFIRAGLKHIERGEARALALLLPADFDSAATRARLFGYCGLFRAKLILTKRIVWFEREDGEREAPKENHAWYIWERSLLRRTGAPLLLHQHQDAP